MRISVIIPAYNEADQIGETLDAVHAAGLDDVVVVDGGSADDTVPRAQAAGAKTSESPRGRASQMNAGAQTASGDVLLFLHADTRLPCAAGRLVENALEDDRVLGGAFHLRFDSGGWLMRLLSFQTNLRSYVAVPWGDQALFVRSTFFLETEGYRQWCLMEDVEMAHRIKKNGQLRMIRTPVVTSGRRFREHGFVRSAVRNQILMAAYYAGVRPDRLARFYSYDRRKPEER